MENAPPGSKVVAEWIGNRWNDAMNVSSISIPLSRIFHAASIGRLQFRDFA